ncbi:MFS transporter [Sphingomonas sp. JC676]|uniref:MFS transporter n=1 Tax=Sphingomonas sp. JC676 TaxID=2768065 RepID=UPI001657C1FA|nr:MFS transporter [Sphingomonas sp. JC676]MBC9031021.1 MFS transporter [Sphingomonas sp. JC676]
MAASGEAIIAKATDRVGRYRWVVVWLLFAATAINYIDRQMIAVLKPDLAKELHWSETDYAHIVFYFQAAYAIGYLGFGKIVDAIGARFGYAIAVVIWTIAHVAHGGVHSVTQFAMARFGLGIGESGNFPAGVKAVADWFPAKERAFAIGLFNAGSNVGAICTPLLIWAMVPAIGWRMTFVVTGVFGVAWLIAWLAIFRDSPHGHAKVSETELAHISQDPADPAVKVKNLWGKLVLRKETWAFALGKFFIDPIWWFYLFWLPSYIGKQYGLNLTSWDTPTAALALAAIYLISDVGSIAGGWLSGRFMNAGMSVNKARKLTMLIAACFVLPVMFATQFDNLWLSVFVIGVAAAAHQAFSATLYALPSDLVPRYAVGSVIGIGGTLGAIGGMVFTTYVGYVLDALGSYTPLFVAAGAAYFLALLSVQLLSPRLARAEVV